MTRRGIGLLFVAAFALGTAVSAQPSAPPNETDSWSGTTRAQGGIAFQLVTATGEFGTFVPDGVFGVMGHLDMGLGGSIVSLGGDVAWIQYGKQMRRVSLASLAPEVPYATIDVETLNAMITLHGRLRVQTRRGRRRPYVDGLYGFTNIYTQSSVTAGEPATDGRKHARDFVQTQARDFVSSYGAGAGVMIRTGLHATDPQLDFGVRYLKGGRAHYLTEGSIRHVGGDVIRDFVRSRTDMISVYVGVAFGR